MSVSRERVWALLFGGCAALGLAGCATWKTSDLSADQLMAEDHPRAVRRTLSDARVVPGVYRVIDRDSSSAYVGQTSRNESALSNDPDRCPVITVPLADVRKLEFQGISAVKTT